MRFFASSITHSPPLAQNIYSISFEISIRSIEHAQGNEELYTLLASNPELREEILLILSGLGKRNYTNSSSFFFDLHSIKIKNAFVYVLLALLPVASIVFLFYSLKHGLACLFGSFLINTIVYYRNKSKLENDLFSASYAAGVIRAGKRLASVRHPKFKPHAMEFKEKVQPIKKILVVDRIISFGSGGGGDFDLIFEYIRILFLLDFISYNKIIKTISKHRDEYRDVWERIGNSMRQ